MPPLSPSTASSFMFSYYILPAFGVTLAIATIIVSIRSSRRRESYPPLSPTLLPAEKQPLLTPPIVPPPHIVSPSQSPPLSSQKLPRPSILDANVPAIPPIATSFLLSLPPPTLRPYEEENEVVEHVQPADYANGDFPIVSQPFDSPEASTSLASSPNSNCSFSSASASRDEGVSKGKGAVRFGREARLWRGRTGNGVSLCRRDTWMKGDGWNRHVRVIQGMGPSESMIGSFAGPIISADSAAATAATNMGLSRNGHDSVTMVF